MRAEKAIPTLSEKDKSRFWAKIDKSGPTQPHMDTPCWVWAACKTRSGYGQFSIGDKMFRAHRVVFVLNGGILDDENPHALHRCDFPSCCNPEHIFAATHTDNMRDMEAKGRGNQPRGESQGSAKLTAEKVTEIRSKYAAGGISQAQLSRDYDVSESTVRFIVRREFWKHVA